MGRLYDALDGLRGCAAILVVLLHIAGYFQVPLEPSHAYLSVDFFFMLSGFVIAYAYDHRLKADLSACAFIQLRVIRLYPMIVLGVLLGLATWLIRWRIVGDVGLMPILVATLMNVALLPTPGLLTVRPWAFPLDSPLWSLSIEMMINIIYALGFRFAATGRLIVVIAAGALALYILTAAYHSLNFGFVWGDVALGALRVVYPFFLGVVMFRLTQRWNGKTMWGHCAAGLLVLALCAPVHGVDLYDLLVVLFVFPAILLLGAHASPHPLLSKIWQRLGGLSYPLYVTHYPFVAFMSNLAHQRGWTGWPLIAASSFCLVFVLLFAAFAEYVYDEPVRYALRRWFNGHQHRPLHWANTAK